MDPGYWSNNGYNNYAWNPGYWGVQVGYYGGVNYGYGYYGNGYGGGRWQGNQFQYNTAVSNVNRTYINNVYVNQGAYNNSYANASNRVSYNGGQGGVQAHPTVMQRAYSSERHVALTPMQTAHIQTASSDRNMYASVNRGRPAQVAVARPYSANTRPANYAPVRTQDRQAAQAHVVSHPSSTNVSHATEKAPQHVNTVSKAPAQPQQHAAQPQPQQHAAQPQQHASQPQQHASQPQQHAAQPQQHAAQPQQHASQPQQHAQQPQQHASQPQQHAAQPQQHAQAPAQPQHAPEQH